MDTQLDLINSVYEAQFEWTDAWDVGLPLIGGGIGGLQRHNIIHAMERILGPSDHNYTLVER
jgi:hypothetical protein